jgi:DNA-binding transcriptional ArsR family regulator
MDRGWLEECLAAELSLEAIGERVGKHPSTVSYWLKKHGLKAAGHARHAPKGTVDLGRLRELAEGGATIREIAAELDIGYSTARYWLSRCGLETDHGVRRKESSEARQAGLSRVNLSCPKHGHTSFGPRSDGGFRCQRCNSMAVSERRRQVKRQLVGEAGGACAICGFSAHPRALEFHHLDPVTKRFQLSQRGLTRGIRKMRAEAAKCVLLCANCHALVEAGVEKAPAIDR